MRAKLVGMCQNKGS